MVAGMFGGLGRGVIEGPFEYVKVRRQVNTYIHACAHAYIHTCTFAHTYTYSQVNREWSMKGMMNGTKVTLFRNMFLFSSFVTYMDISDNVLQLGWYCYCYCCCYCCK